MKRTNAVPSVTVVTLPEFIDPRGRLVVGEFQEQLPFIVRRYFAITDVPADAVRGEHAHKTEAEFLVCAAGACTLRVDDGTRVEEFRLDSPTIGVVIPPRIWRTMHTFAPGTVLLVLVSTPYRADDYINDYSAFIAEAGAA